MEKHIYIFKAETGECKIGVSNNVDKRRSAIEMQGGKPIIELFYTTKCFNAYEIENIMHRHFADNRLIGEWFDIDFDNAVSVLKEVFNKNASFVDNNFNNFNRISLNSTDRCGLKMFFEKNNNLSESENVVLALLRTLYTEKFDDVFALSLEIISYHMTNRFMNCKNNKDRTIINYIKNAITSLDNKGIIDIIDQSGNNFVLSNKGLKLSEIKLDETIDINLSDISTIFTNVNKPFDITQFYINLKGLMKNGECQISQDEIVNRWNYSKATVNSYIKQLEDIGLIVVNRVKNECNTYISNDR